MQLLGIDTGGTFTDFVLFDGASLRIHKVLSTPDAPDQAILQGIADLGINLNIDLENSSQPLYIIHGSTVATNAVLEGKGVRTAFITNHGLGDILTIGRQARRDLYDLQPRPQPPPVPRLLCLETGGRIGADGSVVDPLTEQDLKDLRKAINRLAPEAVAINLLFSFLDDAFEKSIEQVIPKEIFVSRSSSILPEYREYERGITTWLNAWIGPIMQRYLASLISSLGKARLSVMQSSGGTIDAAQASESAVRLLLSGPAGGLAGAQYMAQTAGHERVLTFDMGGTSTDVALIDGTLNLTSEGYIGPYPVAVPMVDMHTIGAGGGSIALVDPGGLLQVGPQSAGADPGPACYGRGGQQATVTDANLVLGRLQADVFLGGAMGLDEAAARRALNNIAKPLGLSVEDAALGVVRVANEHMVRALRVMSVQRGVDPRELTLVSFGGAGGLHVCALAKSLKMRQAMVPVNAGVLSALGMLVAPRARELSQTVVGLLAEYGNAELEQYFLELSNQGREALMQEGVKAADLSIERSMDLRYRGQSYYLNVPWSGPEQTIASFHARHQQRYGHRLDQPVELVNVRVSLRGKVPVLRLAKEPGHTKKLKYRKVNIYGVEGEVEVIPREALNAGYVVTSPALITETVSTTYLAPDWRCQVDQSGNLLLNC
jgi:N-methylhydantoinase A